MGPPAARRAGRRYGPGVRVLCGTSGFSYAAWRGTFYPAGARSEQFLALYAAQLPTVEINNSFYRMPTARLLATWRAQVPAGFSFVLKGPQRITHHLRMRDAADETAHFHEVAAGLGPSLGPQLWQLPPNFRKDLPRLAEFLSLLPAGNRPAFEFRHQSWFSDDVLDLLRNHGAALVAADDGERDPPLVATARFGYLRLRAPEYSPQALDRWCERILSQPWEEAWVFFKHEEEGPALAHSLMERLGAAALSRGAVVNAVQPEVG
jgi:uncharacterized protein YecE (DUF72 family)